MAGEKLDTQVRRQQIVQAVLDLIAAQGLKRLSMGAVARRVGLVPSAIYRHFRNKDEMIEAALRLVRQKVFENINAVCAATPGALDRLERLLRLNVRMIREIQAIPRVVFAEGVFSEGQGRRNKIYQMLRGYMTKVEEIIAQGQRAGEIRGDIDARTLAVIFWGLLPPAVILWHVSEGRFDVTRHVEKSWKMLRAGLAAG